MRKKPLHPSDIRDLELIKKAEMFTVNVFSTRPFTVFQFTNAKEAYEFSTKTPRSMAYAVTSSGGAVPITETLAKELQL